jgi:2-oxoglutarate decarboxylase
VLDSLVKVALPEMGESVTEGSIVEWRKKPGQWVEEGETLVDVTTDKVDVEVPSTVSGLVSAVFGKEGDTVAVGAVLVEIDTTAKKPEGDAAPVVSAPAAPANGSSAAPAAPKNGSTNGGASYKAQLTAEHHGLDLSRIAGTGPDGLVLREDVDRAIAAGTAVAAAAGAAPSFPVPSHAKVTELKGAVGTLATYMDQSLSIPTATSFRTFAVGALEARRAELNAALKGAGRNEKISFTHIIAYAIVQAAKEQPAMTAAFRRENGKPQRVQAGTHLGLAVDAQRKDGSRFLVVPVLKNADTLDFIAFHKTYEELVAKTRDNKLTVEDQTGATFTLTNPGGIGTVASVPRLMVGQGAIIATGAITVPPGFGHAPDTTLRTLGVEKVMTMTSTYDHRVIQGAQSGEFLKRVDELLRGNDGFYESIFGAFGLTAGVRGQSNVAANAPVLAPHRLPPAALQPTI